MYIFKSGNSNLPKKSINFTPFPLLFKSWCEVLRLFCCKRHICAMSWLSSRNFLLLLGFHCEFVATSCARYCLFERKELLESGYIKRKFLYRKVGGIYCWYGRTWCFKMVRRSMMDWLLFQMQKQGWCKSG